MEEISFEDLGLCREMLEAVAAKGFESPSPIQILAIPRLLNGEANVIARARTGTGKTAAFALPLIQTIREDLGHPQALVLAPTRELALQVCKELDSFVRSPFPRTAAVYGGQSMGDQLRVLKRGVDIVVGTPGRVQDHLERGSLDLSHISYFILDEADEMLDMGFIEDIEAIFSHANPESRILLFSATMPPPILKIAACFMGDYEIVEEETDDTTPVLTEQKYWMVREADKIEALIRLIDISNDFYGLVFTQTRQDADTVARALDERGYEAAALHGDIAQAQREKILQRFRRRKTRVLVATDVAARGIDIEGLSHVVNYALPFDAPTYIHRIGRTGRAGARGLAFTFVRPEERRKLDYIRQAVQKNTQGRLEEGSIPDVQTVLQAKRGRIFAEMKKSLGLSPAQDEGSFSHEDDEGSVFARMAESLCSGRNAEEVLASVLSLTYGRELDPEHYGRILPLKGGASQDRKLRLYVQLGRRDGYSPRDIAEYFSRELRIPQRLIDDIDLADNFCLVSLPVKVGNELLERSRRDRNLPHVHVDVKSMQGRRDRMRYAEAGGGRRRFAGGERRERPQRREDRGRGFSNCSFSQNRLRQPAERSGALLYKRGSDSEF